MPQIDFCGIFAMKKPTKLVIFCDFSVKIGNLQKTIDLTF
jgi:hypothetical protein